MKTGSVTYGLRIIYAVAWLGILAYFLITVRGDEMEHEAKVVSLGILQIAGAPISYLASGLLIAFLRVAPDDLVRAFNSMPFALMWISSWIVLFALSFWQWFYLIPRIVATIARWASKPR